MKNKATHRARVTVALPSRVRRRWRHVPSDRRRRNRSPSIRQL